MIVLTYLGLAAALFAVAWAVWARRNRLPGGQAAQEPVWHAFGLLRQARFGFGALGIFLYVGAEVAIGSVIVNFLMQPDVLGLGARPAGELVPLYWGGAMIGRFIGAYLLRICAPGKVLASAAAAVILLLAVAGTHTGALSGGALLAIGLFNSIMFPTIFALARKALAAVPTRARVSSVSRSPEAPSYRSSRGTRRMSLVSRLHWWCLLRAMRGSFPLAFMPAAV